MQQGFPTVSLKRICITFDKNGSKLMHRERLAHGVVGILWEVNKCQPTVKVQIIDL